MSDEIKNKFAEMREDLRAVQAENKTMVAEQKKIQAAMERADRRFDTFLARFDEVTEMLVDHDTDQLQRVTAVESAQAALKEQVQSKLAELEQRVDALEKKEDE